MWRRNDAEEWRRSWLCRCRHKHDYADLRIMPTWWDYPGMADIEDMGL